MATRDVACPHCHQAPGLPCAGRQGMRRTYHAERVVAARMARAGRKGKRKRQRKPGRLGRRPKLTKAQCDTATFLYRSTSMSISAIAKRYGVSPATMTRVIENKYTPAPEERQA